MHTAVVAVVVAPVVVKLKLGDYKMKITKEELANIIKEEVEKAVSEKTITGDEAAKMVGGAFDKWRGKLSDATESNSRLVSMSDQLASEVKKELARANLPGITKGRDGAPRVVRVAPNLTSPKDGIYQLSFTVTFFTEDAMKSQNKNLGVTDGGRNVD